ncbi:MAG: lysophospholipid acyltransferase family protein [Fulvivirga sp.]|nr:lysophospholipid acyltransferase family protein [Fulvivirga sp.]
MMLIKLLSRLPLPVLYALGDVLYIFTFYVIGYREKVVTTNIKNAFPEKSPKEIKSIRKTFYKRFSEHIVETLKAITISESEILKRVKFVNVPAVQPYADQGQSILFIGSHQFNWEWVLQVGCLVLPFPVDAVYKRLSNKKFDQLMKETRGRFGGQPIEKSKMLRQIVKTKDRLRALAIVADQSPRANAPKYWTKFMHQDTAFFLGPEQIAKAAGYPTFFYKVERKKRGYYTVELVKLAEPPYEKDTHEILEKYVRETEKLIKNDPPGYMWSHRRWKLKKS